MAYFAEDVLIGIRYRLSELFARRTWASYMLLFAGTVLLVLVGALAFHFGRLFTMAETEVGATSVMDAIRWSFNHALDTGTIVSLEYTHSFAFVTGIIITIMGVVFTSVLIGLISSSFIGRLDRLRQGVTAVRERDHVLLLGWSLRALSIVRYFVTRQARRKVVILSKVLPDDIDNALRQAGLNRSALPLVIRTGDPTVADELERVSVNDVGAIVVVSSTGESSKSADVDATVIKTLMTIKSYFADSELPKTVAEIVDRAHRDVAEVATGREIPYLVRRDIESRLLVQLCRYPGLGYVLAAIWGQSDLSVVLRPAAEFTGGTIAEVTQRIIGAAVIGVSWKEVDAGGQRDALVLNPPADYELEDDDMLVFISSPRDQIREMAGSVVTEPLERMSDERQYMQCPQRLLILGCNEAIDEVIVDYDAHAFRGGEVHVLCSERDIESIDLDTALLKNTQVHYHQGDTWRRAPLVAVDLNSFDVVLVLAEPERTGFNNDAITLLTLLLLNDIFGDGPRPKIICEINNDANRELIIPNLADDLLVGPEVISVQLARIAEEPLLGAVNKELSSAGGVELALHAISDYALSGDTVSYAWIQAAAQANNETAIGIFNAAASAKITMYPAPDTSYPQHGGFQVIVLAHQVFA